MLNEIYSKHNLQIKTEFEQLKKATTISKDSIAQKKLGILTEEKCNPTSPVCLKTLEKKKNLKKKQSFLIYRQAFSPHILPNYIQDISQKIPFKEGKKKSAEDYELSNEETMKLMQKPENSVLIGRFHHICFKKHITSRQRKKEDFSTESFNMIIDEKSSKNDIEKSKMLRSSSLKKLKNSEINIKTNEKFSEKVNNSKKNSFLNFFKNSFCIAQQLNPFQKNIEPRILDFDSFLVKDKPTYQKNEYFNILQSKGSELLKQEQKVELENFYENGLGLLPLSSLDTDFFDKFKNEMERSKSISFNKHFLDDN